MRTGNDAVVAPATGTVAGTPSSAVSTRGAATAGSANPPASHK